MSDNESDGSDPSPIRSKVVAINIPNNDGDKDGFSYTFKLELCKSWEYEESHTTVSVNLKFIPDPTSPPAPKNIKTGEDGKRDDNNAAVVGQLRGNILKRPSPIFFEMADEESAELQGLACLFCESDGKASRILHPALQDQSPEAVRGGGFLHIERVHIEEPHRGKDLGLRLIHEVLVFLDDLWTIAVMEVGHVKTQRHFGRMGFLQAGRKKGMRDAWFLTKELYFERSGGGNNETAIETWIPKDRAGEVEVHTIPLPREVSAPDEELKTHVTGMSCQGAAVDSGLIEDCIRNGASINNSCVLHIAAANTTGPDISVLKILVRLGGDVNATDENGMTPLHVAAGSQRATVVRYLLESGANASAEDLGGATPLQTFTAGLQNTSDFYSTFGMSGIVREVDVIPKFETAKALMTSEQRSSLIEGWMPPRMYECLLLTCDHEEPKADIAAGLYTRNQPTPLDDVCRSDEFSRIEYIPMSVLKSDSRGIFKSFHDAWKMIVAAIWAILKRREVPTVNRIEQELHTGLYDLRKIRHYKDKGGKVEFALDAVLKVTENVFKDGDDGWEYCYCEEEIEAHIPTPLDEMYDVARCMCINRGGGTLDRPGPHRDVSLYGL